MGSFVIVEEKYPERDAVILLSSNDKDDKNDKDDTCYYIYESLFQTQDQISKLSTILNTTKCSLHKRHYYNIDVLKRSQSAEEMLEILSDLKLNSYIGKYTGELPSDDLKLRNMIRGMSNVYEDIISTVIAKLFYNNDDKILYMYFCLSEITSSASLLVIKESFDVTSNSIENFIETWYSNNERVFTSNL